MTGAGWRPRVLVCGTGFGRVYLAALRSAGMPFELAGILARGSERSRRCAEAYGVPLFTDLGQVGEDVDVGCVVVGSQVNGGPGARIAVALLERGVHVLQEHPLHHGELADCLRAARRHGVQYAVNTNYVRLDAVSRFTAAARRLLEQQPALLVDAVTSVTVLYTLVDILGQALGGIRPWSLTAAPATGSGPAVLRSVDGVLAGVPTTLRVQNRLDPVRRDNGALVPHRVTLATAGGDLLLANTQGPVVWTPRLHMPADYADAVTVADSTAGELDLPGASCLTAAEAPTHRRTLGAEWPAAAGRALLELREAILADTDPMPTGQYHLAVSRLVADVTAQLGRPELVAEPDPRILAASAAVHRPDHVRPQGTVGAVSPGGAASPGRR